VLPPSYYNESEGRWLTLAWWAVVGRHGNATTAALTYAVGYAALVAGMWRVLHRAGIRPKPTIDALLGIALFAALAIESGLLRFARAFRIGIFIPFAVPGVVAVLMWGYLYGDFGPFTQLARQFELPIPDFLSPAVALASLADGSVHQADVARYDSLAQNESRGFYFLIRNVTLRVSPNVAPFTGDAGIAPARRLRVADRPAPRTRSPGASRNGIAVTCG
jgi:hypothetical protein